MTHRAGVKDIGEMLSSQLAVEKRNYLIQNIMFLARQGMALRGDNDESDSNFMQLLKLRSIDDTQLLQHLEKKSDKYTSPQIQNEILSILSLKILREIGDCIRSAPFFCIMADEVTDSSNREQVVVRIR